MALIKPKAWYKPTYYPQCLLYGSVTNPNRFFGICDMYADKTFAEILSKGITHLLDTGGGTVDIPVANKFALVKFGTEGVGSGQSWQQFRDAGYNYAASMGNENNLILTGELEEQLQNTTNPNDYNNAEAYALAFYRGYIEKRRESSPGLPIGDTNCFGEYRGIGAQGAPEKIIENGALAARYRTSLSSQTEARRRFFAEEDDFKKWDGSQYIVQDMTYFANGHYDWVNVLFKLYAVTMSNRYGSFIPNFIYHSQKMYLAAPDRAQFVFTWELVEDLPGGGNPITLSFRSGYAYQFTNPAGKLEVKRNFKSCLPPYMALQLGFFACLLTRGLGVWSAGNGLRNVPLQGNHERVFGYWDQDANGNTVFVREGSEITWTPEGGTKVNWVEGDASMPQRTGANTGFSKFPMQTLDAFYEGYDMREQIHDYCDDSLEWVKFSRDGGATWYTPEAGSNGLHLSKYGSPNAHANSPVIDLYTNLQGIGLWGTGTAGEVAIYCNTFLLPTETEHVIFDRGGTLHDLGQIRGTDLFIKTFPS